jgi:hypothetical protein
MTFAEKIIQFNKSLVIKAILPGGVEVLNPYQNEEAFLITKQFYNKFYADNLSRTMILGINPGRFGGGITGIPFTDPIKLETFCGIENTFQKKAELSADFIYRMIEAYGGSTKFYNKFYIGAVSPLGFTKSGKNLNYYDIKSLEDTLQSFIIESLQKQLAFGINTDVCFCLGEGENFKYLKKMNNEHSFFKKIIPLPHPRFIMQYRRKRIDEYSEIYLKAMSF